ncbi:MAG: SDR family NAD(P)-dependent oxidoreductase [Burkholderiales bacterium]
MGRLEGKAAVASGGAGGIGAATARLFCEEGARVLLADRDATAIASVCADSRDHLPGAEVRDVIIGVPDSLARPRRGELGHRRGPAGRRRPACSLIH